MKKIISITFMLTALCGISNAQFLANRSNGVCLTQDERHLYMSSGESNSFIVMDKASRQLAFYDIPEIDGYVRNVDCATATDGDVLFALGHHIVRFSEGKIIDTYQALPDNSSYFSCLLPLSDGTVLASMWQSSDLGTVDSSNGFQSFLSSLEYDHANLSMNMDLAMDAEGSIWSMGWYKPSPNEGSHALIKISGNRIEAFEVPEELGLASNSTLYCVEIDAYGNVWYSTGRQEGDKTVFCLVKFDGRQYTCYDLPEIVERYVTDIKFDERGRLWVLSWAGPILCFDDIEAGKYTAYTHELLNYSDMPKTMLYLQIDGETVYASGSKFVKAGTVGMRTQRPVLAIIKDGKIDCFEIEPAMDGKSITGIGEVAVQQAETNVLYDLQGRRLTSVPAKGVYIQNGRKVMK